MTAKWFVSSVCLLQFLIVFSGCVTDGVPFSVTWNAPTELCRTLFGINVDVKTFGLTENPKHGWVGPFITIVYSNFGRYPFVDTTGTIVNGGIPQAVNLTAHWEKVRKDIERVIPDPGFSGFGVIDWEAWRPMWEWNWDKKKVYQDLSTQRVRKAHPSWDKEQVERAAKKQFETAARVLMAGTLQLVSKLRPFGQWGYYHFADCYNERGERHCKPRAMQLNDKLAWLFRSSSGLFPSAYLSCDNATVNKNYVRGEVEETCRLQRMTRGTAPIYLYTRVRYRCDTGWYIKEDLVNSIGQALALGINGVIIWDDHLLSKTAESCSHVKHYVDSILGPYVRDLLNVSRTYRTDEYDWNVRPSQDVKVRPRAQVAVAPKTHVHAKSVVTLRTGWKVVDFFLDSHNLQMWTRHLDWMVNQLRCLLHNRCIV